jgi:RsbT co-antagonist protein rsbRD N-terminal domain
VSSLLDALRQKRGLLAQRWAELVFATYPAQSAPFLSREKDRFRNPLGATIREELAAIVDVLLDGGGAEAVAGPLDAIVRVRAVQEFSPAEALGFVFQLKQAVAELAGRDGTAAELLELHARIDELALQAFAVYVGCRERVFELRAREATARTYSLLKRAGALTETDAAEGPPTPPGEGRS